MAYSREQRKWAAARRAQFALKTALERIDFMEDVVKPELEALGNGTKRLEIAENSADAAAIALEVQDDASN